MRGTEHYYKSFNTGQKNLLIVSSEISVAAGWKIYHFITYTLIQADIQMVFKVQYTRLYYTNITFE